MYRLILLFFVLIFSIACSNENKIPKDVLPPSKMQNVMWDMLRADEFVTAYVWNNDTSVNRLKESIHLYEQIFRIHNTTKDQFQKSLSFYQEHPALFESIVDSLNKKEHPFRESTPTKFSEDSLFRKNTLPIE